MQRKFISYSEALDYVTKNEAVFKLLYIKKDMTAKKVAENQNIFYDNNFAKALLRVCGKKGLGQGGARVGAGQKKKTEK